MNMLSTLTREDDVRCSPDDFAVAKENLDTPGASSSELSGKPNHIARIVEWYAGNNNLPTHETGSSEKIFAHMKTSKNFQIRGLAQYVATILSPK